MQRAGEAVVSGAEILTVLPGLVFDFRVEVALIRGRIRGTDQWAVMCYAGRGRNRIYLANRLLVEARTVATHSTTVLSVRSVLERVAAKADIVFVDIGIPYDRSLRMRADFLELPDWISMTVPIHGDWERVESGFNKTTRKLVRRMPYSFEFSRSEEVITGFYDDFYLPYLKLRHEDAAIESRRAVERRARQGGILRVIGADGPIAAGVVYPEGDVLYYLWLGMAERYLDAPPEGALAASYYFCLRHAHENGFRVANWMGTRAFPTDGVFQFKRKWGVHVEDSFSAGAILFRPAANNATAVAFASGFPVLARRDGRLEQIFCTTAETLSDVEIRRMLAGYHCAGIDQVTIVHVRAAHVAPSLTRSESFAHVRILATDVAGFAQAYRRVFDPPRASGCA